MTAFQSKLKKLNIVSQHSTKRGMAIFSLIIIFAMLLSMPAQLAQSAAPAGTDGVEQVDAAYSYTNNVAYNIPDGTAAPKQAVPTGRRRATSWSMTTLPSTT